MSTETMTSSYTQFQSMTEDFLKPIAALMESGRSTLPLIGMKSDHAEIADKFEAYARPALLAALWLQTAPNENEELDREEIAKWFRDAMIIGTDPNNKEYWGEPTNFHQLPVEMTILVMAIDAARDWLWEPLTAEQRQQIADWFGFIRGNASPWNNHLFFDVLVLEFLQDYGYGMEGDRYSCDFLLDQLQSMYQSDGWFIDGTNETFDYYNAFAFHTYGLYWSWRYGKGDAKRSSWWKDRSAEFLQSYVRFFAEDGSYVPFGRSIIYRFNALGVFGMAEVCGLKTIPSGQARRICRKNLEYFINNNANQSQGCLSVGWTNEFPAVAEPYSCAGSTYWAAKGLMMLLLPPDHEFWTAEETPAPSEQGDSQHLINASASIIRSIDGEVEYINGGGRCSPSAAERFGPWKWGRMAYRSGFGYLVADKPSLYPRDVALTASDPTASKFRYGRHAGIATGANDKFVSYACGLGEKLTIFHVKTQTVIFWNRGWLFTLHRAQPNAEALLELGTYALPGETDDFKINGDFPYISASNGERAVAIQSLLGFDKAIIDRRDGGKPRQHLLTDYHALPVLQRTLPKGVHFLSGLLWAGTDQEEGKPWAVISMKEGHWTLEHPSLGTWQIDHPLLPEGTV